jgi:putative Mn2+ efflux pump MntP
VWTAIFLGVDLVGVLDTGAEIIGAVILVVLGLVVLFGALLRGGRTRTR